VSFYDRPDILDNATFWDRQGAGRRVAVGSVRELFGRFRHYRNRRKDAGFAPLLVIVGHSFGGMIVYSALAQSLIEAATPQTGLVSPRFADLVLLVNPAVEAARYLPIYDLVQVRMRQQTGVDQPPVFICATASNDWATKWAFPIGNALSLVTESYRGCQELQAMINTIGHLNWMKTHDLASAGAAPGYQLSPVSASSDWSPFWVVLAAPDVINGHNDIFMKPFLRFVRDQVFRHVRNSRAARTPETMPRI
jgi:pimeloyl-ACP methyl ester carboxylesterase